MDPVKSAAGDFLYQETPVSVNRSDKDSCSSTAPCDTGELVRQCELESSKTNKYLMEEENYHLGSIFCFINGNYANGESPSQKSDR